MNGKRELTIEIMAAIAHIVPNKENVNTLKNLKNSEYPESRMTFGVFFIQSADLHFYRKILYFFQVAG